MKTEYLKEILQSKTNAIAEKTTGKFVSFILTYLLLLSSVAAPVMACGGCDPPCGNCERCISGRCVPYGDCPCGECETCQNCWCQSCAAQGKVCCEGVCTPKCEDGEPTGQCDTSYNEECIGCTVFPYTCSDFKMREYTGSEVYYCSGGCPGDCVQQNAVECYVECECKYGTQLAMRICATQGGGVACVDYPDVWFCTPCVKNDQECVIEYAYPRKCQ